MGASLVLFFAVAWVVQGALFTVDPQVLVAAGTTNVTVASVLPSFSAGFSYRLLAAGGAQLFPCAPVVPTRARCELSLPTAADYTLQLQALPPGEGQAVSMTSVLIQVYQQPAVAAVSPTRLPRSGGQLFRVLFASPLNATGYPRVGRMVARLVRRDTGAYDEADLHFDDPTFASAVGRSPNAKSFPEGCVADVHLSLNGINFMPTGQNVTFGSRPLFKIAFIYVSAPDDFGWTFQHNSARLQLEKTFFGQIETMIFTDVKEFGPNICEFCTTMPGWDNTTSNWVEEGGGVRLNHGPAVIMRDVIENHGVKLIFATSFWYHCDAYHMAARYPNVSFVHVGGWLTRPNMAQVFPRIEQARYLSGIAMAWYIKSRNLTKRVGFTSSFPLGETGRAINAVKLGMELVDPEIEIFVTWLETWHDDRKEAFATRRLIEFYGVEGIAQHTDSRTPQLTARDLGKMGTGYNTDMLLTVGDSVLTSPVFIWAADYTFLVQKLLDGDTDINFSLCNGASRGAWRLSDLSPTLPPEAAVQIAAELARFQAGDDTMWCKPNMYDNKGRWRNGPTNPAVNPVPWEAQHLVPGTTCLTDPVISQVCQEYDASASCKEIWLLAGVYDSCTPSLSKPGGIQPPSLPAGACFLGPLDIPDHCPPGQILDLRRGCTDARPGFYASEEKELPCSEGYYGPSAGLPACLMCQPGKATAVKNATECRGCMVGKYADKAAMSQCEPCPRGTFGSGVNATQCAFCPAGTYSDALGASGCVACPGTMTTHEIASVTAASCVCGVGTHRRASGTGCDACPDGSSTAAIDAPDVSFCLCNEGTYMTLAQTCAPCPDSMVCPFGSSEGNYALYLGQAGQAAASATTAFPRLLPGFWSSTGEPLSVFWCDSEWLCPGGDPGTCANVDTIGPSCASCAEGYHRSGKGCRPCRRADMAPTILVCLVGALVVCSVSYFSISDTESARMSVATVALTAGQVVSTVQMLTIFRRFKVQWEEPLLSLLDFANILTLHVQVLKLDCIFGKGVATLVFLLRLLCIPAMALLLLLIMAVTACWKVHRKQGSGGIDLDRFINGLGLLFIMVYISITVCMVEPLQCTRHPNGKHAMSSNLAVLCWETSEHAALVAMSCVGFIAYPVAMLTIAAHVSWRYPAIVERGGGAKLLRRCRFLLARFRPECYYWGFWYVLRNLLLPLIPVAFPNASFWQIFLSGVLLVVFLCLQTTLRPWRTPIANFSESVSLACVLVFVQTASFLVGDNGSAGSGAVSDLLFAILVVALAAAAAMLSVALYRVLSPPKKYTVFLSHHKDGAACLARWFKMSMLTSVNVTIFLDSDELDSLDLVVDVVRSCTSNFVLLLTKMTLTRLWCAAEIAAAMLGKVHTVRVECCDFNRPTEEFFSELRHLWTPVQLQALEQHGIGVGDIAAAYRRLQGVVTIDLQRFSSMEEQKERVCAVLAACSLTSIVSRARSPSITALTSTRSFAFSPKGSGTPSSSAQIVMLGASSDAEARTTTEILRLMVIQKTGITAATVYDRDEAEQHRCGLQYVLLVLTRGLLNDPAFASASMALVAADNGPVVDFDIVTALADTNFTFPAPDFYEPLEASGGASSRYAAFLRRAFNILALSFSPSGSWRIMQAQVEGMAFRFRPRPQPFMSAVSSCAAGGGGSGAHVALEGEAGEDMFSL